MYLAYTFSQQMIPHLQNFMQRWRAFWYTVFLSVVIISPSPANGVGELPYSDNSIEAYDRAHLRLRSALKRKKLRLGNPIFIRIFKQINELELWVQSEDNTYTLFKTYIICYQSGTLGPKLREGDSQSPEGFYRVDNSQMNPWSNYHLAFNLGYPNEYDRVLERTGSALMIHGRCSSSGCFAMTDYYMDEIYSLASAALQSGQEEFQVHIFPFRLTPENLADHQSSRWLSFWQNLKEGYDLFERHHVPPHVGVLEKRYVFSIYPDSPIAQIGKPDAPSQPPAHQ